MITENAILRILSISFCCNRATLFKMHNNLFDPYDWKNDNLEFVLKICFGQQGCKTFQINIFIKEKDSCCLAELLRFSVSIPAKM